MEKPPLLDQRPTTRGPITWRSVSLGLIGTIAISSIAYFNDFALNNTFLIGNNLPLGLVMMTFLFIVLVNGPLSRYAPRYALSSGELVVAFSMALVSCAIPSGGLMRWMPHAIVAPFWHAQGNKEFSDLLISLNVPDWLYPNFGTSDRSTWFNHPIVNGFMQRWTGEEAPPYLAWIRPAIVWGIPTFAAYVAITCIMTLVRRQWAENERLPFPLVQIQLSLLESPRPGRWFNAVLLRRSFWIGFAAIFMIHLWNGGFHYFPRYFPEIPISYNLGSILANPPWNHAAWALKASTIFFTVVGVAYFLNSSISFSIWSIFIGLQIYRMSLGSLSGDPNIHGMVDQRFGGILAFLLVILWIGRAHWKLILRQAFRGAREGEPEGRYLSYPFAFWALVGSGLVFVVWLMAAGSDLLGAVLLVFMLLTLFLVTARFVAETGLVHSPALVPLYRPLQYLGMAGFEHRPPVESFYLTGVFESTHYDMRETVGVYSSHAMRLSDHTIFADRATPATRSLGRKFMGVLLLAMVVGYIFSWGGVLVTEYAHGATLDRQQVSPINHHAVWNNRWHALDNSIHYANESYHLRHSPGANFAFGFGFTALLSYLRLHFVWWPLHPIGYLILQTFPGNVLWFSFFLGWIAKQLVVRFGSHTLYVALKPFFLGIIVGESIAAGFWLLMSIALAAMGYTVVTVRIMPW